MAKSRAMAQGKIEGIWPGPVKILQKVKLFRGVLRFDLL